MYVLPLNPAQPPMPMMASLRQATIADANALFAARLWQAQKQLSKFPQAEISRYLRDAENITTIMLALANPAAYEGVYESAGQSPAFIQLEAKSFPAQVYELVMEEGLGHPTYLDKTVKQSLLEEACWLELSASHLGHQEQLELLELAFAAAEEMDWRSLWFSVWQHDRYTQTLALESGMTLLGYDRLPEHIGNRRLHKMLFVKTLR